ncbi:peptidase U32 family protein [Oceanobacillus halophilus]|uniref:U32 family peptidase n=1 Tax=Oceanobacillus halophilus TaxID=930130 RepID=A0A495A7A1_9BACI|nr:peptidase U32 family protein [Oceanobacillus halophilus]RKQ35682.1 U32 family peptidase [Oceanobacillus halophilus]
MIELITTAESASQAESLLQAGIDILYIGEDEFGLRLPTSFSREQLKELTCLAHEHGKQVRVAVNAIMHNDRIATVVPYLQFLQDIGVDSITVGDPGVLHVMKKNNITLPFIYDAQTLVTSANQINFWAKRGAAGAVLAREITYPELVEMAPQLIVPAEVLVYGATCIHQSKRPLVENYFNFVDSSEASSKERGLFISEPKNKETHYSIYEDRNGTHVFATNDINLLAELNKLHDIGLKQWKLDGIFTRGEDFVSIAKLFVQAKLALESGNWSNSIEEKLSHQLINFHPNERGLDKGFYAKDPSEIQ